MSSYAVLLFLFRLDQTLGKLASVQLFACCFIIFNDYDGMKMSLAYKFRGNKIK